MSSRKRLTMKVGAVAVATGFAALGSAAPAFAAATPINDPGSQGGVIIMQNGVRVQSGDIQTVPFATQDIATSAGNDPVYSKATLYFATPVDNQPPGAFPNSKVSAATTYDPTTQFPTVSNSGNSLASYICQKPNVNPSTSPYANEYELRVAPSGPGKAANVTGYIWTTTLYVTIASGACNGTSDSSALVGTWTQVDAPAATAPTGPTAPTPTPSLPEAPYALLLPLVAVAGAGAFMARRKAQS